MMKDIRGVFHAHRVSGTDGLNLAGGTGGCTESVPQCPGGQAAKLLASIGENARDRREGFLVGFTNHELVTLRKLGVQFATHSMPASGVEVLADADAQVYLGVGIALLEALRLGRDVVADLWVER
jgi:hypothetical protein